MISYISHGRWTPLYGLFVHRCPLWPDARRGPNPPPPVVSVEGQPKRGPRNVLVADFVEGPWAPRLWVVPARTLRRLRASEEVR